MQQVRINKSNFAFKKTNKQKKQHIPSSVLLDVHCQTPFESCIGGRGSAGMTPADVKHSSASAGLEVGGGESSHRFLLGMEGGREH